MKYPGGKTKEVPLVRTYMPLNIERYFEPFVGGGSVYFDLNIHPSFINDFSFDLINLYTLVQQQDEALHNLLIIFDNIWHLLDEREINQNDLIGLENFLADDYLKNCHQANARKQRTIRKLINEGHELDNNNINNIRITARKTAFYMMVRKQYNLQPNNNAMRAATYFFLREYCYDYAEALCRCLNYTGLFKTSGRSIATKLRVAEYSKIKFDLLLHKYDFKKQVFSNVEEYMDWFGKTSSTNLPWNNIEARRDIVKEKIEFIKNYENDKAFITKFGNESLKVVKDKVEYASNVINSNSTYDELKTVENNLVDFITSIKEKQFIEVYSKTSEAKQEILDMYDQILEKIDMGALWLEVNTWKSLIAVGGNKIVKRNFNVEEDLTPKSFAPGIGNTPDMELYTDEYIIIPEVSLMTGTQQWEHEASSVIDHVLSFIKDNNDKTVRGLFISSSLNIRTKWQFFILNKESWVEKPVPVIPLTIGQYKFIIETIYNQNLEIMELIKVLEEIHEIAKKSQNYTEWFDKTSIYVQNWKSAITLRV